MKDITPEVLKESEISDLVINSLPGVFYVQDIDGNYLKWNKNFEKVSGYAPEEIRKLKPLDFFDVKDHERITNVIKKVFEEGEGEIDIEAITKDGKKIPFYLTGKLVNYEGVPCLIGMGIDISERVEAEKQSKRNQERLNYHINNSPLVVIEYDKDLRINFWSKRAKEIYGWGEEVMGKKITEFLIHTDDINVVESNLLSHNNTQARLPLSNRNYTKDGRVLHCRWHSSFLTDERGDVNTIMSIIRDITDLWKAEKQSEEMANDLAKRNNDLEQFTYIVSHNLRAPIASLIGLVDVLSEIELSEEEKNELITGISYSAHRLDDVIKDLNDILHLKNNYNESKEAVSFSKLVAEIEQHIRHYYTRDNFVIETDFSAVDECYTLKHYLSSIFSNLISNSIKYRQPDIEPFISIRSELDENKLILIFKDNGIGLDLDKMRDEVFGLYKRFHDHVEGKGLGLFMVRAQVETLGGTINITSEVNKGTEFKIEFDSLTEQ